MARKPKPDKPIEKPGKKGLSISEFAKLDGASSTYVYRAIAEGRLAKLDDGSIDPALVGSPWRAGNKDKGKADEGSLEIGDIKTRADAERVRAYYEAQTAKIEFDEKIGTIAPVRLMLARMSKDYSKVRARLLAIPAECAPDLILIKTAAEMQQALLKAITAALKPIAEDPTSF